MSFSVVSRQRSWNDIEALVTHRIDEIDARDDVGNTALYYACKAGNAEIVSKLIESGADINKRSYGGMTSLMSASQYGHTSCLELLIQVQVDIHATCEKGELALHKAVENNFPDCARLLVEAGSQATVPNNDGFTSYDLCKSGYMRRLLYLSALGISSLHSACLAGNEERLVQELLSEITDIDRRSVHDMTALMVAAEKGHLSCLQILLSSSPPADPNLINMDGNTALHLATKGGHWKLVEPLLRAGSNPHIRNQDDQSVLDLPASGYIQRIIRDFLSSSTPSAP